MYNVQLAVKTQLIYCTMRTKWGVLQANYCLYDTSFCRLYETTWRWPKI